MIINNIAPEEVGIGSADILNFHSAIRNKNLSLHSAILHKDGFILSECYYAPFKEGDNHRMFSIAKSAVALAVGLMADEGLININDALIKYFPEKRPVHPYLEMITIKDMLMMRTCHASTTYDKFDLSSDWVGSFFTKTPTHKPGTVFHYDTGAPFVLSALCEKLTGKKTWDYVKDALSDLEFSKDSYFIEGGMGVSHGGSGLVATSLDILKLGIFFLNEGKIDGKQIVSRDYMRAAVSNLTPNCIASPLPSESCGYGYYVWRTEKDGFVLYGMGGQLVIVCPKENMILVTTADTQGYSGGNQIIYDAFYENILEPYRKDIKHQSEHSFEKLRKFEKEARLSTLSEEINGCIFPGTKEFSDFLGKYDGAIFCFREETEIKTADGNCQNISNPLSSSHPLKALELRLNPDFDPRLIFTYADNEKYDLPFGYSKNIEGTLPLYKNHTISSAALIAKDTLYIRVRISDDLLGSVHIELYLEDELLTLYMKKIEETSFKEFNTHLLGKRITSCKL